MNHSDPSTTALRQVFELLESASYPESKIPPTLLYNEGWLLRLVLSAAEEERRAYLSDSSKEQGGFRKLCCTRRFCPATDVIRWQRVARMLMESLVTFGFHQIAKPVSHSMRMVRNLSYWRPRSSVVYPKGQSAPQTSTKQPGMSRVLPMRSEDQAVL
jgi:hypothetical protein